MRKLTTNEYIKRANIKHNFRYSYDNLIYLSSNRKVEIICNTHGIFEQEANSHLRGVGCPKCSGNDKSNHLEFIEKSMKIHGDKYDYSNVEYINAKVKVKIICKIHGEFEQTPDSHLNNCGCRKCSNDNNSKRLLKKQEDFISECKIVHSDKYDYSLVNYLGTDNKVEIICKKHGIFTQKASKHLYNQGCPICRESKLEKKIRLLLMENNIDFKQQYGSKSDEFYLNGQKLDFYLPDYKIAIECQGEQHFSPVDFGNKGVDYSTKQHNKIKQYDQKKYNLCENKDIKIIYFCNKVNYRKNYIGDLFHEPYDIINKINNI